MNTDFPLKAQDAIIGDVIIYPEMDMSRTEHRQDSNGIGSKTTFDSWPPLDSQ